VKLLNLEQGSPDWLQWRNTGIGSSDAPVIYNGNHFGRSKRALWREKVQGQQGRSAPRTFENPAMRRGKDLEPVVRAWYQRWLGHEIQPRCGTHDDFDWMKASLDGWVEATSTVVEIKCPGVRKDGTSDHATALQGEVPEKYLPQLYHLALVAGGKSVHYVSHGDPGHFGAISQFTVVTLDLTVADHVAGMERLLKLEREFWEHVVSRTEP